MQALARIIKAIVLILPFGISLNAKEEHPAYTRYAKEIRQTFIKQVKKEFGFNCEMTGGGMPYDASYPLNSVRRVGKIQTSNPSQTDILVDQNGSKPA